MADRIETTGQIAPAVAVADNALEMSIYFVAYNAEARTTTNESPNKTSVAPFTSLRVQVRLTAEEAGLIREALRSCRAVFVETEQADGEADRIMLAVGTVAS